MNEDYERLEQDYDNDEAYDTELKQEIANDDVILQPALDKPPKPELILTEEQQHAVSVILEWMEQDDKPEFKLGGYAGTGKTTVIKTLLKELRKKYCVRVAAFTGKAVNVLERKGVSSQTLHSLMYNVDVDPKTGAVEFIKRYVLEDDPDVIIVDESSMVSTELYNDLRSFNLKLLFVGDPGQLEPVGDNPNLMLHPDLVLEHIHRQAADSPIILLGHNVRHGSNLIHPFVDSSHPNYSQLEVRPKQLKASEAVTASQIICARNKTRTGMNDKLRLFKGISASPLVEGEKIIVLKNNRNWMVFNGMILFVEKIHEDNADHWLIDGKDEVGNMFGKIPIWKEPFTNPTIRDKKDLRISAYVKLGASRFSNDTQGMQLILADYGYVITCHKSQGSEWPHVLVFDEWMPAEIWDMRRWRYTAITRASEKLTYLI